MRIAEPPVSVNAALMLRKSRDTGRTESQLLKVGCMRRLESYVYKMVYGNIHWFEVEFEKLILTYLDGILDAPSKV